MSLLIMKKETKSASETLKIKANLNTCLIVMNYSNGQQRHCTVRKNLRDFSKHKIHTRINLID